MPHVLQTNRTLSSLREPRNRGTQTCIHNRGTQRPSASWGDVSVLHWPFESASVDGMNEQASDQALHLARGALSRLQYVASYISRIIELKFAGQNFNAVGKRNAAKQHLQLLVSCCINSHYDTRDRRHFVSPNLNELLLILKLKLQPQRTSDAAYRIATRTWRAQWCSPDMRLLQRQATGRLKGWQLCVRV